MPAATITTTAGTAFTVPVGSWGYEVCNNSDTTLVLREAATVALTGANQGMPLVAGEMEQFCFAEKNNNPVSIQAVHGGTGGKELLYDIIKIQRQGTGIA